MQTRHRERAPDPRDIAPFWTRLRAIAAYPLQKDALLTISVLTVCHVVAYLPFGWFFDLFVWIALYKYACECLRATANGRMQPPEVTHSVDDSVGWDMIKLQVILIIIGVAGVVFLPPALAIALVLLLAFAQPAASMSLAMDESLPHALNPLTWFALIGRLRGAYFIVFLLTVVFLVSRGNLASILALAVPGFLARLINDFLAHYVILATFHLMGYLIWQYHAELGYEPAIQQPLARLGDPDSQFLDGIRQQVADGHADAAITTLRDKLRSEGGSPNLHAQYRKLLALGDHRDESLRHGQEWLQILIAQDDHRRALDVARECMALDPAFRPSADAINVLAEQASKSGQSELALKLLLNFHKAHPKHRDIPANYLLAAKLLAERMGRDGDARRLTAYLLRTYPEHALRDDIATYDSFLAGLATPKKPDAG